MNFHTRKVCSLNTKHHFNHRLFAFFFSSETWSRRNVKKDLPFFFCTASTTILTNWFLLKNEHNTLIFRKMKAKVSPASKYQNYLAESKKMIAMLESLRKKNILYREQKEEQRKVCDGSAAEGHFPLVPALSALPDEETICPFLHASFHWDSAASQYSLCPSPGLIFLPPPPPPAPPSIPSPPWVNQYLCPSYQLGHLLPGKKKQKQKKTPHCLTSSRAKSLKDSASSKNSPRGWSGGSIPFPAQ